MLVYSCVQIIDLICVMRYNHDKLFQFHWFINSNQFQKAQITILDPNIEPILKHPCKSIALRIAINLT